MRSNDMIHTRSEVLDAMQQALKGNDAAAFAQSLDDLTQCVGDELRQEFEDLRQEQDASVLSARGIRQLTGQERKFYQAFISAAKSRDPKQAITGMDAALPETVITAVFDELETAHPLLSRINFTPSRGAIKMLINESEYQQGTWGELTDTIVKEVLASFVEVDTGLLKLSAFLPVSKAMLDMGPEWIDRYVRRILYDVLANGLEAGIISGDGDKKPIGMDRQVGSAVSVVGGKYPQKSPVSVTDLSPSTVGSLLAQMSVDAKGKQRQVRDVLLIVNPQDYYQLIMPATTVQAPDGTYRNDVLPYPMDVIQSSAVTKGKALIGLGKRYFASAGTAAEGRIEYSDHYQFLEDKRVYLIKAYANGFPMDNNAFLLLDISGLKPYAWRVQQVTAADDAT